MSVQSDRKFDWAIGRELERKDALLAEARATIERLHMSIQYACDLLAERATGNSARSPGHNARLILEAATRSTPDIEGKA